MLNLNPSPLPASSTDAPAHAPVIRLRRYALAILFGLLALFGLYHLALQPAISKLVTGVPFINSYGRQRMLSQRLTKAVLAAQFDLPEPDRQKRLAEASNTLAEWSRQHQDLLSRDVGYLRSPLIEDSIRSLNLHFQTMESAAREFLRSAEQNAPPDDLRKITSDILREEPLFLETMNRIVGLYEEEVRRRVAELRAGGWVIFGLLLALALFLHLSILSPAFRSLASLYNSNLSRYQTLVEHMTDGLALVDHLGTVQFANRRLLTLLQLQEDQLLGRRLDDFLLPGPDARGALLRAIAQQEIIESRFRRHRDSIPLDAVVRSQTLDLESDREQPLTLLVVTDISEEKAGRERLKELQNRLARINRLKTVGEMSASLAHELGQPLCAISAFVVSCRNILLSPHSSLEKIDEHLERVELAAGKASEILTRFRNYGRMTPQVLHPLRFSELIADVEKLCRPLFAQASARLHSEIAPDLPRIEGDQLLIQQVLINLIQNSLHALADLPAERRTLDLVIAPSSGNGIEITLVDRGRGISTEDLARMQEPFFTTRPDGLGLGLAICRTIIEEHEGHLRFTSEIGLGTTVRISLPAVTPESSTQEPNTREPSNV